MFNASKSLPGLLLRIWKVFTPIINYLPEIIKWKLNEPHGNWWLRIVQSEYKTKFTYNVVESIFE